MNYFKKTSLRLGLPLFLAVSAFSGAIAEADQAPPTATAVQVQTYGVLPVMLLNLTPSAINVSVTGGAKLSSVLPLAIGLSGVYTDSTTFTNATKPGVAVDSNGLTTASLMPALTTGTSSTTYSSTLGCVNLFSLFPSWSSSGVYGSQEENLVSMGKNTTASNQWMNFSNLNNLGAAVDAKDHFTASFPGATAPHSYNKESYISMGYPSTTTINMSLFTTGVLKEQYAINVNSLGGGTSAYQTNNQGETMWDILGDVLAIAIDVTSIVETDGLGIADILYSLPDTINTIEKALKGTNNTTDQAYPATYKGINVTAAGTKNILSIVQGDQLILKYQPAGFDKLPLVEQNSLIVATWKQPLKNTGRYENPVSDLLIVAVVNNGIITAKNLATYINGVDTGITTTTAKAEGKPTALHAHDTTKIFDLLSAVSKTHPQDVKYIVEMFGTYGKYKKIKNDPVALKQLHANMIQILEEHQKSMPALTQYLTKLKQAK